MSLSAEFQTALDTLENSQNHLFVTGRAGTGKSTLLNLFRNTTRQKMVVLAPTGIAALNVKGQTIHSFFGFPPRIIDIHNLKIKRYKKIYQQLDTIVIDEISMVRADIIDNIDIYLQRIRNSSEPFGGVRMIFFGDLFQLPPIVASPTEREYFKTRYESPYFFSADVVNFSVQLEIISLNKVYRQDEKLFIRLLDNIRTRHFDMDDLETINERTTDPDPELNYITLTSRNDTAFRINDEEIRKLDTPPFFFNAAVTGEFNPRLYPTEASLGLKLHAQVMFVKNDPDKRFVNGTIGKIVALDNDLIQVRIRDLNGQEKIIELEQLEWEIVKYDLDPADRAKIKSKVVGTFKQYPIKLAWAITIHKSQGKTFDHVIIDLGRGAFEYGQSYVALSRCRTLNGIVLKNNLKPTDIRVDQRIVDYYDQLRRYS
jgi:ATP-dependent exoDNAse (exonuclease V) alpha subunit